MFLTIDSAKCKQDGLCAMACPMGLIVHAKGSFPEAVKDAEQGCVACGHCMAVCPFDALSLQGIAPEELLLIDKDCIVGHKEMEQLIRKRRSTRKYQSKTVPHEILEKLIDTMRWSPTAANLQPIHWLVVEKPDEVKRIAGVIAEGARKLNFNPAMVEAWDKGLDVFLRGAPHLVVTHASTDNYMPTTDCAIALTCLDLMACAYGLGTCWAGVLMIVAKQYPPLVEALGLPEGHEVYGAMMLGYPKFQYHRIPDRKPSKVTWR